MKDGIIVTNKPYGMTSTRIVRVLKDRLNAGRIGHCGTLDPLAEGVLVICFGRATKLFSDISTQEKVYSVTLLLGCETETGDVSGDVVKYNDTGDVPAEALIRETLSSFVGEIEQVPPIYSAIKHKGRRLYDYARSGETVEIKSRIVKITKIDLLIYKYPYVRFNVACSSGTYVRSLAFDMGRKLGLYATVVELSRIRSGVFSIENSLGYDALRRLPYEDLIKHAISLENITYYG